MDYHFYRSTPIEKVLVEGCGWMYRTTLYLVSEDGRQDEFLVEEWTEQEAEEIRQLWKTQPRLVYMLNRLQPMVSGPE